MKNQIIEILERYDSSHVKWLVDNFKDKIIKFCEKLIEANRVFICGNGGSLTTAQHLALDFSKYCFKNAICLDSPGFLTAYANDFNYESVFTEQLKRFGVINNHLYNDDIIIVISCSGNSKNIISVAKKYPCNVICMSGLTGYLFENIPLTLPSSSENIRVTEDAHLAYGHAIAEVLHFLS
jgi:D-sedoheptulose 7-phosphate isomerase